MKSICRCESITKSRTSVLFWLFSGYLIIARCTYHHTPDNIAFVCHVDKFDFHHTRGKVLSFCRACKSLSLYKACSPTLSFCEHKVRSLHSLRISFSGFRACSRRSPHKLYTGILHDHADKLMTLWRNENQLIINFISLLRNYFLIIRISNKTSMNRIFLLTTTLDAFALFPPAMWTLFLLSCSTLNTIVPDIIKNQF